MLLELTSWSSHLPTVSSNLQPHLPIRHASCEGGLSLFDKGQSQPRGALALPGLEPFNAFLGPSDGDSVDISVDMTLAQPRDKRCLVWLSPVMLSSSSDPPRES